MSHAESVFIPNPKAIRRCRGCGGRIFFASTEKRERMPVSADATPDGNLMVADRGPALLPFATVLRPGQALGAREQGMKLYRSHFADCPEADAFRKRARNRGGKR